MIKQSKRIIKFSVFVIFFMLFMASACKAEEVALKTYKEPVNAITVKVNKKWTITFKQDVNVLSLNNKIYVAEDQQGMHKVEGVNVVLSIKNPRQVEVIAPENGYKDGVYYLFIDKGVSSITKCELKDYIRMKFVVLDSSLIYAPARFGLAKDTFVAKKNKNATQQDPVLPSSFDLRKVPNKLSEVRDQGGLGNCWAFSAIGSLESTSKSISPDLDLSEQHLKNTAGKKYDYGVNGGGNRIMATAYFASGMGPALEKEDPYADNLYSIESPSNIKPSIQVSDVDYIVDKDINKIKEAVYKYGAVYSGIFYRDYYLNGSKNAYFFDGYDGDNTYCNHAIDIVGWDDNYSKDNFWGPKPKKDGAYIVRNSWGTDFGEAGYIYVSYEDKHIATQNAVYRAANEKFDNNYQYDTLGCTDTVGFSTNTIYFANVFDAKGDESVRAVSFYTDTENTNVKIFIANQFDGDFSKLVEAKTLNVEKAGYHTVNLDSAIKVKKGAKFAIGVNFILPTNLVANAPVEKPVMGFSSNAKAEKGQSYISGNGKAWSDITDFYSNTNVCIKAFTNNDVVVDKTALNQQLTSAVTKYNEAIEGTTLGEYLVGSKGDLKPIIDEASAALASDNTDQLVVNAIAEKLKAATSTFNKKMITIASIDEIKTTVKVNAEYVLPTKVVAKLSNDTTKEVEVVWTPNTVDMKKAGTYNFTGKVEGYAQSVFFTLTVEDAVVTPPVTPPATPETK